MLTETDRWIIRWVRHHGFRQRGVVVGDFPRLAALQDALAGLALGWVSVLAYALVLAWASSPTFAGWRPELEALLAGLARLLLPTCAALMGAGLGLFWHTGRLARVLGLSPSAALRLLLEWLLRHG
jgi:hypothetical protein